MYYERIIFAEENFLRNKYGEPYLKWTMETPIFIPRLSGWQQPNLDFSIKNVLKREYSGFFALFFTFALFDLIENYMRFDGWHLDYFWNHLSEGELLMMLDLIMSPKTHFLDDFWAYSLCIIGSITIILRTLKKKTKILHVKGR